LATVDISGLGDAFVIYFDKDGERINAYTLASTLVGIADAAKAANAALNLGYDIEVVVEALGPGSFKAMLRAIYKKSGNLFSDQAVRAIILSIIANFIYERAFSVNHPMKVEIFTNEVIIENGKDRIIVPRNVYEGTRSAERNPLFGRGIGRAFESIASDEEIKGVGLVPDMSSSPPEFVIPRSSMSILEVDGLEDDPETRVIKERCDLQIVKAILERSTRKWEFMWRGVKISAPVLDSVFYDHFFAHSITIAPGDVLQVLLAIKQTRDQRTGIYTNVSYEVIEFFKHIPRMEQTGLLNPDI